MMILDLLAIFPLYSLKMIKKIQCQWRHQVKSIPHFLFHFARNSINGRKERRHLWFFRTFLNISGRNLIYFINLYVNIAKGKISEFDPTTLILHCQFMKCTFDHPSYMNMHVVIFVTYIPSDSSSLFILIFQTVWLNW